MISGLRQNKTNLVGYKDKVSTDLSQKRYFYYSQNIVILYSHVDSDTDVVESCLVMYLFTVLFFELFFVLLLLALTLKLTEGHQHPTRYFQAGLVFLISVLDFPLEL